MIFEHKQKQTLSRKYKFLLVLFSLLAIFMFAEFVAKQFLYDRYLHNSYELSKKYYSFKGDFGDFKKIYEKGLKNIEDTPPLVEDPYHRYYYHPAASGHKLGFLQKPPPPKQTNVTRIICIGTSTVENGFPSPLADFLDKEYPGQFEVVNAGIPGASILNTFMNYSLVWKDLQADIVILEHNVDEICSDAGCSISFMPFSISDDFLEFQDNYLSRKSMTSAVPPFGNLWRLAKQIFGDSLRPRYQLNSPPEESKKRYKETLESFVYLIKGSGAKPILMTYQPTLYPQEKTSNFSDTFKAEIVSFYRTKFSVYSLEGAIESVGIFNSITKEVARETDSILVDTVGLIPSSDSFFADGTHHSSKGAAIVASKLIYEMKQSGILTTKNTLDDNSR